LSNINQSNDREVLESIKMSRIILPIILGLGVVLWLMSRQLDLEDLKEIPLTSSTLFWIFMAILMYIIRHLFYAWRLRVMTSGDFKFWKSMELIVIWEFASAVSPTSIGGSAVALFLLAQEKISGAKTVAVVLYSMVLDTIFFIVSLPLLIVIIGPLIIRPGMENITDIDGYGYTFFAVVGFMASYGALFAYGLFYRPVTLKRILLWLSKVRILGRFKKDLRRTALDVVITFQGDQQQTMELSYQFNDCDNGCMGYQVFSPEFYHSCTGVCYSNRFYVSTAYTLEAKPCMPSLLSALLRGVPVSQNTSLVGSFQISYLKELPP
jgi:hypothetical protein